MSSLVWIYYKPVHISLSLPVTIKIIFDFFCENVYIEFKYIVKFKMYLYKYHYNLLFESVSFEVRLLDLIADSTVD